MITPLCALALFSALPLVGLAMAARDEQAWLDVVSSNELQLAPSLAEDSPLPVATVTLDREGLAVEGEPLLSWEWRQTEDGAPWPTVPAGALEGQLIVPLFEALLDGDEDRHALAVLTQDPSLSDRPPMLLLVDRTLPFQLLHPVLYTASRARFGVFHLAVDNPWLERTTTVRATQWAEGAPQVYDPDLPLPCQQQLVLSVTLGTAGIDILNVDAVVFPEEAFPEGRRAGALAVPCGAEPCLAVEDFDWVEYSRLLSEIKFEYIDHLVIIVAPEPEVAFEVLVRAMDHARWGPHLPLGATHEAWQAWRAQRGLLFPFDVIDLGAE